MGNQGDAKDLLESAFSHTPVNSFRFNGIPISASTSMGRGAEEAR